LAPATKNLAPATKNLALATKNLALATKNLTLATKNLTLATKELLLLNFAVDGRVSVWVFATQVFLYLWRFFRQRKDFIKTANLRVLLLRLAKLESESNVGYILTLDSNERILLNIKDLLKFHEIFKHSGRI
jgi:hypothetical protein